MKWFSASVIMYAKVDNDEHESIPVWENIILIEAESFEDAHKIAQSKAILDASNPDQTLTYDDKPCKILYGGIRKIIECSNDDIEDDNPSETISSGTELSYSQFIVKNTNDLNKLINNDDVYLYYIK